MLPEPPACRERFNQHYHDFELLEKEGLFFALQRCVTVLPRYPHAQDSNKIAAVLLIIHSAQTSPRILLTKRNSRLKYHRGEISFPGGAFIKRDHSLCATAIRETREEIGVNIEKRDILGCLRSVRTLTSNFYIFPFVTIQDKFLRPKAFLSEVESILDAPLFDLLSTLQVDFEHRHLSENPLYNFIFNKHIVWGATAIILKQLWDCLYQ